MSNSNSSFIGLWLYLAGHAVSQVSISPIFYEQLFCMKVFCAAFMCLQVGLIIFWQKDFGAKVAHKMLLKLTPGDQCYKTLIYCHSTVMSSFCVIKQYYDSNYCGMAVSNTMVIFRGISTLKITGIFIALAVNYHGILTLKK